MSNAEVLYDLRPYDVYNIVNIVFTLGLISLYLAVLMSLAKLMEINIYKFPFN